jgi:hypothetical protein
LLFLPRIAAERNFDHREQGDTAGAAALGADQRNQPS